MFKPFDDDDWMAFAGAEEFEDGSQPLVNWDIKVDGLASFAIIDRNGFGLQVLNDDGEAVSYIFETRDNRNGISRFLALLPGKTEWETGELIDMGIEPTRDEH